MMEVAVQWQPRVAFGTPRVLFSAEEAGLNHRMRFDTASDGQHLIMMENVSASTARDDALTIVENWHAEFASGE